ncbi:putative acetyltransferase YvcN [Siminovitchia terrae]|uniref:Acetyltransferase YvcN n=1 Tax=Siminovitchia terrae TaxID=1914933 RepID=A0ABQ4KUF0_SIMTE|nr:arylamine N-acetyltransferase [Siminovitchia terrae]GIN95629.1 putative acetyltransferase YvcN [Siminovitchia terrae]
MSGEIAKLLKEKDYFSAKDDLHRIKQVQEFLADRFVFENLDVLLKVEDSITPEFIEEKMLLKRRGGLCYELNALQHLLLKELGLDVHLVSATVATETGWATDRTHVMSLFRKEGKLYLIDSGFGSDLPLQPVELDGPPVTSPAGNFRLQTCETEKGSIVLQSETNSGWNTRYAFFPEKAEWDDLNRIKKEIHTSSKSSFNRELLIAQLLPEATLSVNEERLQIKKIEGEGQRILFTTDQEMLKNIKRNFNESIYQAAVQYVQGKEKA